MALIRLRLQTFFIASQVFGNEIKFSFLVEVHSCFKNNSPSYSQYRGKQNLNKSVFYVFYTLTGENMYYLNYRNIFFLLFWSSHNKNEENCKNKQTNQNKPKQQKTPKQQNKKKNQTKPEKPKPNQTSSQNPLLNVAF